MLLEKELKFDAVPSDVLPDLNAVVKGATIGPSVAEQLSATYWDTADLALARWGVTLRFRVGDGESDWTLKLPTANDGGGTIVRREFRFPGVHEAVPADAREASWRIRAGRTFSALLTSTLDEPLVASCLMVLPSPCCVTTTCMAKPMVVPRMFARRTFARSK